MISAHANRIEREARKHPALPLSYTDAKIGKSWLGNCIFMYGDVRVIRAGGGARLSVDKASVDLRALTDTCTGRTRWFAHFSLPRTTAWFTTAVEFQEGEWLDVFHAALDWLRNPERVLIDEPIPGRANFTRYRGVWIGTSDPEQWLRYHERRNQHSPTGDG